MGLLFVLIFWAILFCIISLPLGLIGIIIAIIYSRHKNVEVNKTAWFFAPGVLLFSFASLFFFENIVYGIMTHSDIGIGDGWTVNINDKYKLHRFGAWDWCLESNINEKFSEKEEFNHVEELLVSDETIAFTSKLPQYKLPQYNSNSTYYILTQLDVHKEKYSTIDSASTTTILWDRYTKARGINRDDVYTCDEYYWKYRKYFMISFLIFNILLLGYLIRRFGKRFLIEEY